MQDDSRIIAMLEQRDEQALTVIREQFGAMCYQVAYRITGSREDAEECVNDTLMAVWNSIPPQKPDRLAPYLASLTSRRAINRYKHTHSEKRGGTQFTSALDELAEIIPSAENVERQVERRELTDALTKWLRTLSPEHRRIFMQRYFYSESIQAVAQANQMSADAVKMLLMRLRRKLQKHLRKEGLL